MLTFALLVATAFVFTLGVTPICRAVCIRYGWLDQPDYRKIHRHPIPRTGGIAIIAGYIGALCMILVRPSHQVQDVTPVLDAAVFLPALCIIFVTGLVDDVIGLRPWMKIGGQTLAAGLACASGVVIRSLAGVSIAESWCSIPLTIVWLVGCANALNLIDGLDGLAAGVGLFAAVTAFASGLLHGNVPLALATAPLIGALLGFLPYNFNPASIFMGDCGSLSVGFLLGCFGIIWTQKSATVFGMTAPLVALSIPLLDTAIAISRRFLNRQPLFGADRGHIHHRLLARGFTTRRVAYIVYAFAGTLAALSLLLSVTVGYFGGAVLLAACGVIWIGVRYLGYEEFAAARSLLFGGVFRRAIQSSLAIRLLERRLRDAGSLEDCWLALLHTSREFGFSRACLHLHHRLLAATLLEVDSAQCWRILIPLNGGGHLDLSVPFHSSQPPATIHPLAISLGAALAAKLNQLSSDHERSVDGPDLARLATAIGGGAETVSHSPSALRAFRII